MNCLVGTGLVGKQLQSFVDFDFIFNTKNSNQLLTIPDGLDLWLACPSGTKWKTNLDPNSDLFNCIDIYSKIKHKSWNKVHLFSSIDVYLHSPLGWCEEETPILPDIVDYASNRRRFELLVETLTYADLNIWRLPALFSSNFTKNVLWDLIHKHELYKINPQSHYQWYNLEWLESDMIQYHESSRIFYNLFTEPVKTESIINLFDNRQCDGQNFTYYDWTTNLEEFGYIKAHDECVKSIQKFVHSWI